VIKLDQIQEMRIGKKPILFLESEICWVPHASDRQTHSAAQSECQVLRTPRMERTQPETSSQKTGTLQDIGPCMKAQKLSNRQNHRECTTEQEKERLKVLRQDNIRKKKGKSRKPQCLMNQVETENKMTVMNPRNNTSLEMRICELQFWLYHPITAKI
jgi:hypothetical protein